MLSVFLLFVGFVAGIASARDVCETRVCIERAKQFLDSMDTSVNPCDDFYQFSCGRFLRDNNFDQEEKTVSVFTQLEADLQIKLRRSLMKIDSSDEDSPEFMREMKDLYDKCLDTAQIEVDGMPSLTTLLHFIEGRDFLDANWTGPELKLERRVRLFTEAGFGSDFLIDLDFIPNLRNTSELIINFSHAGDFDEQTLFRRYGEVSEASKEAAEEKEDEKEVTRYAAFIFSIGRGLKTELAWRDVTDIIILNRRLLMAALEIVELKKNVESLVNIMTVAEMQSTYPLVNWTEYIRAKTFNRVNVTDSLRVNIMEVGYFHTLMEILNDTSSRTIAQFQTLKAIINHMDRVSRQFRNMKNRMANSGTSAPKPVPRWRTCVADIVDNFGMGISYVYVKDYGSEDLKNFSIDIITRLKEQYEIMLSKSQFFDEPTFEKAKEKLNAVVNQIAYSDDLLNLTMVRDYYKGLRFENVSYFDSVLLLTRLNHLRNVENYVEPTDFTNRVEFVEVAVVNGFYIPFANSIQIPMGILQSKFIDMEAPLFCNYGSIGFTMAHELSHAFDDFGRQFDWKGNVANWYSDRATELNSEKEKCIIDKFNEFVEPETELQINGNNTLTENLADLGGILIAYNAYKNAPVRQGHDSLPLPGLNYTLDQQFWLAYSTNWCSSYRNTTLKSMIEYDMHAPAQFRINGALQNVPEFASDFNCAPGTPMNPTAKCTVF